MTKTTALPIVARLVTETTLPQLYSVAKRKTLTYDKMGLESYDLREPQDRIDWLKAQILTAPTDKLQSIREEIQSREGQASDVIAARANRDLFEFWSGEVAPSLIAAITETIKVVEGYQNEARQAEAQLAADFGVQPTATKAQEKFRTFASTLKGYLQNLSTPTQRNFPPPPNHPAFALLGIDLETVD
jgi:hypothetical protein